MGFQELQAQPPPTLMLMVLPVTTSIFNSKVRAFLLLQLSFMFFLPTKLRHFVHVTS